MREQKSGILDQLRDRVAESGLELNKPDVSEHNKKEEEMKGFDPCLLVKEQMGVQMERAKTAGPVLQSLKETFEVVRQIPLQSKI